MITKSLKHKLKLNSKINLTKKLYYYFIFQPRVIYLTSCKMCFGALILSPISLIQIGTPIFQQNYTCPCIRNIILIFIIYYITKISISKKINILNIFPIQIQVLKYYTRVVHNFDEKYVLILFLTKPDKFFKYFCTKFFFSIFRILSILE